MTGFMHPARWISSALRGFGCVADAVFARGFRIVHGRVGARDELLRRLRVLRERGDAEGGSERETKAAPAREEVVGDALAYALGDEQAHLEVGFRQNDDELVRSEEHTSELQSLAYLVCRLLL